MSSGNSQSWYKNLTIIAQRLKAQYGIDCYTAGYALFCRPCPRHSGEPHDALMFDPLTAEKEKFLHFVPWTCASDPYTYFDLLVFTDSEIQEIKNMKLTEKDIEDARAELLARHYITKGLQNIKDLIHIYEDLFGKAPLNFTSLVQQRINVIKNEAPTQPLPSKAEPTEQEVEEAPAPSPDWIGHILIELMDGIKAGDPNALKFKEMLKSTTKEIEDSLNPTTICEYVGSVFICEPCPRHKDSKDVMIIYPDRDSQKTIYFCLNSPGEKFDDPYLIPDVRLGDAQVLETFGGLIWKQWRDYVRGEAEVLVRFYRLMHDNKTDAIDTMRLFSNVYQRIFGKKAPITTLSIALDKLSPPISSGKHSANIESLPKIEPDPTTVVNTWNFSIDNLYAKIVGLYKNKFSACYKVGYMLFCEPCPIHPDKKGDMLVLDPLARIGIVWEPLWTCTYDPYTYYERPTHDFAPLPGNIVDAFDELQETYSDSDIEKSRVELLARYFSLVFSPNPKDFETAEGRAKIKMILKPLYWSLFRDSPEGSALDKVVERLTNSLRRG